MLYLPLITLQNHSHIVFNAIVRKTVVAKLIATKPKYLLSRFAMITQAAILS
jgi:hypothetical protein